ncbi:MAG TPA: dimethylsulfonioproprionate lyase family protein [Gammaproteobacteria bacterium]|nr:dimethylsulfonioproprionate lyase family protein [Gammaproteobacteria bacterium]
MDLSVRLSDLELLEAVRDFALGHPHPDVARFGDAMTHWGDDWRAVGAQYLPAAELLSAALADAAEETYDLLALFERHRRELRWEQSYRREDALVPEEMLDGYGFAEIIGQRGPFVSERIRAGIGVWGPGIVYPLHRHRAEEVYIPLAGTAEFVVGETAETTRTVGDVVHVDSGRAHGFRTTDRSLVVYYLWQAGDLRQTSTFG